MRDIGVLLLLLPLLFFAIRSGYVAYILWGWAGLASVQSYTYGFVVTLPMVQIFALIALVKILTSKDDERVPFTPNAISILFLMFALQITLSATFAMGEHPRNWELATNMLKTILFCLFMPLLVTSRLRIHVLLLVMAIATGFHGVVDGLKFIASAGDHNAVGITKFGDNNHFGLVLLMAIPLVAYAYKYSAHMLVKLGFLGMLPLLIFAVMATQSRGALIGLLGMGVWFLGKTRRKMAGIVVIVICGLLMVSFAPERWVERINTIGDAGQDSSLMGRVGAWHVSTALAIQNPLLGGGPHSIEIGKVWDAYRQATGLLGFVTNMDLNGLPGRGRAAHSIYFETMGDLGFLGFFLFMAILINALTTARKVISLCNELGASFDWARLLAEMLALSVIAYAVSGALLSAAYFELPYIIFMLLETVRQYVLRAARNPSIPKV